MLKEKSATNGTGSWAVFDSPPQGGAQTRPRTQASAYGWWRSDRCGRPPPPACARSHADPAQAERPAPAAGVTTQNKKFPGVRISAPCFIFRPTSPGVGASGGGSGDLCSGGSGRSAGNSRGFAGGRLDGFGAGGPRRDSWEINSDMAFGPGVTLRPFPSRGPVSRCSRCAHPVPAPTGPAGGPGAGAVSGNLEEKLIRASRGRRPDSNSCLFGGPGEGRSAGRAWEGASALSTETSRFPASRGCTNCPQAACRTHTPAAGPASPLLRPLPRRGAPGPHFRLFHLLRRSAARRDPTYTCSAPSRRFYFPRQLF